MTPQSSKTSTSTNDSPRVCNTGGEAAAWAWLDEMVSAICDEEPADLAYSADQMVDAFLAGTRSTQSTLRGALAAIIADPDCCDASKAIAREGLARSNTP